MNMVSMGDIIRLFELEISPSSTFDLGRLQAAALRPQLALQNEWSRARRRNPDDVSLIAAHYLHALVELQPFVCSDRETQALGALVVGYFFALNAYVFDPDPGALLEIVEVVAYEH